MTDLVTALNTKDAPLGLASLHSAQGENVDMRLFMRLLLERIRLVMLLRNKATLADTLLAQLPEEDQLSIKEMSVAVGSLNSQGASFESTSAVSASISAGIARVGKRSNPSRGRSDQIRGEREGSQLFE